MKRKLDDQPEKSARSVYNEHITQLAVADAAVAQPLSSIERCLQRYKVRNRPPLPQTRQDLVLQPEHTVTTDGRRFLLIDDGQADRILVFATDQQLQRLGVAINTVNASFSNYITILSLIGQVNMLKHLH